MRSIVLLGVFTMALFGLGLSACTDRGEQAEPASSAESATEATGEKAGEAGDQVSEWAESTKAELGTFDNKFQEWKAELQGKDAKAEYEEKVAELEKMRSEIGNKLENANEVSQENWNEFKSEVDSQLATLKSEWKELTN